MNINNNILITTVFIHITYDETFLYKRRKIGSRLYYY